MQHNIEQIPAGLTWNLRREVMYPDKELQDVMLEDDDEGIHFGYFENNRLVSVISWFRTGENEARFRKFATLTELQGRGIGSRLLEYVIAYSRENRIEKLWCNARKAVSGFYCKFGFEEIRDGGSKDGHVFVIMELRINPK
jgi:GNAT superfamily N-acetyltransferase